jgi:nicotinate-nucleotide adenylyltransferase
VRIGLFGGTLDPVHFGHLRAAEEVREAFRLDEIWFVPASVPPHKETAAVTPFDHRFAMVELAVTGVDHFRAVSLEAERPGPSYSIDTLRVLRQRHGTMSEFFFILGDDAFAEIEQWKAYRLLTDFASLVIIRRDSRGLSSLREIIGRAFPDHKAEAGADVYQAPGKKAICFRGVTHFGISGTDIRRRARCGLSVRFLVPERVRSYMEEKDLYNQSAGGTLTSSGIENRQETSSGERAKRIAGEILRNKGERIVILDVRGLSGFADYFVISHGRSTRHVQGIVDNIARDLRKDGMRCKGVEGERDGKWVLLDYGDVVVHLFYEPVRDFYDLEGLWSQAPRLELSEELTS